MNRCTLFCSRRFLSWNVTFYAKQHCANNKRCEMSFNDVDTCNSLNNCVQPKKVVHVAQEEFPSTEQSIILVYQSPLHQRRPSSLVDLFHQIHLQVPFLSVSTYHHHSTHG